MAREIMSDCFEAAQLFRLCLWGSIGDSIWADTPLLLPRCVFVLYN
jgi:hypothetical protein